MGLLGWGYEDEGRKVSALQDMIDGGGRGRYGSTFEGGPISGLLNKAGVRPRGYQDRLERSMAQRPSPRPNRGVAPVTETVIRSPFETPFVGRSPTDYQYADTPYEAAVQGLLSPDAMSQAPTMTPVVSDESFRYRPAYNDPAVARAMPLEARRAEAPFQMGERAPRHNWDAFAAWLGDKGIDINQQPMDDQMMDTYRTYARTAPLLGY